ncbi:hypothetical protein V6N11_080160 [Hibiscus sabdariffa]|uniref:Uncharacterized protein n=1 Tax=Hibiscus sabdariffa TaxID=183260 RepID=A0ABR1ZQJ5_9ROSI
MLCQGYLQVYEESVSGDACGCKGCYWYLMGLFDSRGGSYGDWSSSQIFLELMVIDILCNSLLISTETRPELWLTQGKLFASNNAMEATAFATSLGIHGNNFLHTPTKRSSQDTPCLFL